MNLTIFLIFGFTFSYFESKYRKNKIPYSTIIIIVGLLLGPSVFNIIELMEPGKVIVEIIVVFILFTAGYEIDWQSFSKAIKPGVIVGITGVLLSALLGFLVNYMITGRLDESLYIAVALSATSISLAIPLIKKQGLMNSLVGQILLAAAIFDDFIALYLLAFVHLLLTSNNNFEQLGYSLLVSFAVIVSIGVSIWILSIVLLKLFDLNKHFKRILFVLVALVAAYFTHKTGLSAVVGGFLAGAILGINKKPKNNKDIIFYNRVSGYIVPLFYLSIGIQIYKISLANFETMMLILLIVLSAILGKYLSSWILFKRLNTNEKKLLGMSLVPRAEVALIIGATGVEQGHLTEQAMLAIIAVVIITSIYSSISIPKLSVSVKKVGNISH